MNKVPEWLVLLRLGLGSLTLLMMIIYPQFKQADREKHVEILKKFMDNLRELRFQTRFMLQRVAVFVSYLLHSIYGEGKRMIVVSTVLSITYISLVTLVNISWLTSLGVYADAKRELDRSVDPAAIYSSSQIKWAQEGHVVRQQSP